MLKPAYDNIDACKPFLCDVCSESFWQKGEMTKHRRLLHKTSTCDRCDKSFPSDYALNAHHKIHIGEKWFKKMDANKTFPYLFGK